MNVLQHIVGMCSLEVLYLCIWVRFIILLYLSFETMCFDWENSFSSSHLFTIIVVLLFAFHEHILKLKRKCSF